MSSAIQAVTQYKVYDKLFDKLEDARVFASCVENIIAENNYNLDDEGVWVISHYTKAGYFYVSGKYIDAVKYAIEIPWFTNPCIYIHKLDIKILP